MKKIILFVFILNSCATLRDEQGSFDDIQENVREKKYNRAIWDSMAFERNFPESPKLCELWKLQEELNKSTNRLAEKYIEQLKKKQEERCK